MFHISSHIKKTIFFVAVIQNVYSGEAGRALLMLALSVVTESEEIVPLVDSAEKEKPDADPKSL